jgi:hypothetical protein
MSDTPLDDKLLAILDAVIDPADLTKTKLVAQIKQATGQHFYERFKAELDSGLALPEPMSLWVIACAEAASGINNKETN